MNTLHFKYALEVEKTGSITQAADNLYMGQPSLSKAIKELEDTLQIEIFKRSSRGMVPTEEGAQFLQYARNVLIQLDNMKQISSEKDGNLKALHVAFPHSSYLLQAAGSFSAEIFKSQSLELGFYTLSGKEALRLVCEGKLNFAAIRISAPFLPFYQDYCNAKDLKLETIWSFKERVLISDKTAFTPGKLLLKEALSSLTCIQFRKQELLFPSTEEVFEAAAPVPGKRLLLDSPAEALIYLSAHSDSYLRTEPLSKELLKRYELLSFPLKEASEYLDLLLYPKGHRFRSAERLLIDKLYGQKNQIAF